MRIVEYVRYDTIEEFNVDSKAEFSALSSREKKETKTNKRSRVEVKVHLRVCQCHIIQ